MFKFNVKWTTAESSLVHFALSLLVSIIMSVFVASAQYLTSGTFNLQELGVIAAAAFVGSFSRGIISLESNPNLLPAILDGVAQLQAVVTQMSQQPAPIISAQNPPVHIEIHPGAAQPVQVQPNVRQLNAIPVPPRPTGPAPIQLPVVPLQTPDIAMQNTAQVPQVPQRSFDSAVLGAVQPAQ
jgi:hypothetical protein